MTSELIYSIAVYFGINLVAAGIFAFLDSSYKEHGVKLSLLYKNGRAILGLLVNFGMCIAVFVSYVLGQVSYEGYSAGDYFYASKLIVGIKYFWWLLLAGLTVLYISFELFLNRLSGEAWHYISDDGINHTTSPDDKLFHTLSRWVFGKEKGRKYSGYLKFVFKLMLLGVSIYGIFFS